ncbi:HD domain-containing protein [Mameliella sp.]|uniref:HD domain-containing protein n=1 Tax=Mameliella sp. TaxID=1924940 RepID=UPI003B501293
MKAPEDWFPPDAPRLAHIRRVMELARRVEARQDFGGRLVIAAAYHDIGYAETFAKTGFHPVDGAILARSDGCGAEVVDAVLHHSGARGLCLRTRPDLAGHYGPTCRMMDTALSRALTFCDNRSGPNGETLTLSQRIADIRQRHAGNPALLETTADHLPLFERIDVEFAPLLS